MTESCNYYQLLEWEKRPLTVRIREADLDNGVAEAITINVTGPKTPPNNELVVVPEGWWLTAVTDVEESQTGVLLLRGLKELMFDEDGHEL